MTDTKVVIITGSSSGIGKEAALLFAKNGFRVLVHGSESQEKVNKVVSECDKLAITETQTSFGLVANLIDPSKGEFMVSKAVEHFGRIDAVICNAGIYDKTDYRSETCYDDYERVMNVNLNSHISLLIAAAPHLKKGVNPSIIIISDVTVDRPVFNRFAYTMTRAALRSLAASLAVELAPAVRSISVSLGMVETSQFDSVGVSKEEAESRCVLKRNATAKEIANYLWYLSQEALFITGTDVRIDGGYTIKREISLETPQHPLAQQTA